MKLLDFAISRNCVCDNGFCVCATLVVCVAGSCVCVTTRRVCERTDVGTNEQRNVDESHSFSSFSQNVRILLSNHPTLVPPGLFLCACYGRELWHATNYIKVLGSERSSANTIWDYYNKCSINIPLLAARGKPSTWFLRGGLVELDAETWCYRPCCLRDTIAQ